MEIYNNIFGPTEQALDLRSKRLSMISSNIANSDVKGYKAQDMDFKKIMAEQTSSDMQRTSPLHMDATAKRKANLVYRVPINPMQNDNSVEVNYEQAQFGKEATRYSATLQFLENRVGGIRRSLRGE